MPIEYSPNWTGEMESGMEQYVDTMNMIEARYAFERWLHASKDNPDLINRTNTDYNTWQNILNKNPNVGIVAGKQTYWGSEAADFLLENANSISMTSTGLMLQQRKQKPKYPPVTSDEIKVVYGGQQFQYVQDDITDAIVDIANKQACSDAFTKYGLTKPYDVVKSGKLRVAGTAALYQSNAEDLLGWSAQQVSDAKSLFQRGDSIVHPSYTADLSYSGVTTVVFNALQVRQGRFGGIKSVVTHAFIHLGGKSGDGSASPHDLANFSGYGEILKACE
jgi:hypothetical protein